MGLNYLLHLHLHLHLPLLPSPLHHSVYSSQECVVVAECVGVKKKEEEDEEEEKMVVVVEEEGVRYLNYSLAHS